MNLFLVRLYCGVERKNHPLPRIYNGAASNPKCNTYLEIVCCHGNELYTFELRRTHDDLVEPRAGLHAAGVARSLQRAPSSISRELKRNGRANPTTGPRKRGRPPPAGGYRPPLAQQCAAGLARTVRYPLRLAQDGPLWGYGARLVHDRQSPEQIPIILCRMQ